MSLNIKYKDNISELILYLIDLITRENSIIYINSNYKEIIFDDISNILKIQFENLELDNNLELDDFVDDLILYNIDYYSKYIYCRSYENSFILKKPNKILIKEQLNYLKSIYQPEQRTNEWYNFRHNHLTASSIWKIFNTENSKKNFLISKCTPIDINKYNNVNLYSPLHHGQKYEFLSIKWYENEYNTKIGEYGCIPHKDIKYIAASPDGINIDSKSERYGRMLEIKNIFNRVINGIPKKEYWIQMQIQMEVCDLNECDFLETRFIEYDDEESFLNDGTFNFSNNGKQKGIIILFIDVNSNPVYEYSPWNIDKNNYLKWEKDIFNKNNNLNWFKNIYWKLEEVSCVLVERNKYWFNNSREIINDFWNELNHIKNNKLLLDNLLNSKLSKNKCNDDKSSGVLININELQYINYYLKEKDNLTDEDN